MALCADTDYGEVRMCVAYSTYGRGVQLRGCLKYSSGGLTDAPKECLLSCMVPFAGFLFGGVR